MHLPVNVFFNIYNSRKVQDIFLSGAFDHTFNLCYNVVYIVNKKNGPGHLKKRLDKKCLIAIL
jgi:hypothetical protein